jgi:hypothetical protein
MNHSFLFSRHIIRLALAFVFISGVLHAQDSLRKDSVMQSPTGISVSPSSIRLSIKPGTSETKTIRVSNSTNQVFKFKVSFNDFIMNDQGKPMQIKNGESKFGLSKWIVASPTFFELAPSSAQTISVTVDVPAGDTNSHAAWTIIMIDQITERQALTEPEGGNTIAMGIVPSFGFGVYLFQNPPDVKGNQVAITSFAFLKNDTVNQLNVGVRNIGDGIGFCKLQVELTSTSDGKNTSLPIRKFTILPGAVRTFSLQLPSNLTKGPYSAAALLDFGNQEVIEGAELEFKIE